VTKVAEKYLRTGTIIPPDCTSIYPGDLKGINLAMREALEVSRIVPGTHVLEAVYDGVRCPFRIYEDGECIWQEQQPV
jgi:hypothetical protein